MFNTIGKIIEWIGKHFWGLLFILIVIIMLIPEAEPLHPANMQEIKLSGPILDSDDVVKQINQAYSDEKIKGVLFTVDSPGGSVPPSIEMAYAIKRLKKKKPVIAYASGIMASGSYYSSIYANRIYANPGAIVGSIGVIIESADIEKLMNKIGIEPQIIQEGKYKQAGTPLRKWTPAEKAELERLIKDTYKLFVSDVANARGLDANNSESYADAHIFSAQRALEAGLIDEVGVKYDAIEELKKLAKVKKPVWKKKDKLESFIEKLSNKATIQFRSRFYGLMSTL